MQQLILETMLVIGVSDANEQVADALSAAYSLSKTHQLQHGSRTDLHESSTSSLATTIGTSPGQEVRSDLRLLFSRFRVSYSNTPRSQSLTEALHAQVHIARSFEEQVELLKQQLAKSEQAFRDAARKNDKVSAAECHVFPVSMTYTHNPLSWHGHVTLCARSFLSSFELIYALRQFCAH